MPKEPTQVIYIRLSRRLVKKMKAAAADHRRPMSTQIEMILEHWMKEEEAKLAGIVHDKHL